jgi:hypothetical protein
MPSQKTIWEAFTVVGCIISFAVIVMLSGCATMERIDDAIWNQPEPANGTTSQPATEYGSPGQPAAPPIVELIAGAIAAGGFGGMARWLHRIKKNSNGRMDSIEKRLDGLDRRNAEKN